MAPTLAPVPVPVRCPNFTLYPHQERHYDTCVCIIYIYLYIIVEPCSLLNYLHLLGTCNLHTYLQHAAGTQAHNQPVPAQVRYAAAAAAAALALIYPIPIYLIKLQPKVTYPCISIMYIHPISAYIPYFSLPVQHTHPYNHATRLHTTRLYTTHIPPPLCTDSLTYSLTHSFIHLLIYLHLFLSNR